MRLHLLFVLFFVFSFSPVFSQKQTAIWYFGDKAGLDFRTNPPTILTDNVLNADEGCLSMSDTSGNLLFYTNGISFRDRFHQQFNTNVLFNINKNSQLGVFVQTVNGFGTGGFYLFAPRGNGGTYRWHDVGANLVTGACWLGSTEVSVPGSVNSSISVAEKISAYYTQNVTWVVAPSISGKIFATKIANNHVLTTIESTVTPITGNSIKGTLKISPDGRLVAYTRLENNVAIVGKFNSVTGEFTNAQVLSVQGAYGCEFSPDATKLYVSSILDGAIYQFDVCPAIDSIYQTATVVGYCSAAAASMQLALNGRIYIAHANQSVLSAIAQPNAKGFACGFLNAAQSLGNGICKLGLPNFETSRFYTPANAGISLSNTLVCQNEEARIYLQGCSNVVWSIGATGNSVTVNPPFGVNHYTVNFTLNSNGCATQSIVTIEAADCMNIESDNLSNNQFALYPNPTTQYINCKSVADGKFEICDLIGSVLMSGQVTIGNNQIDISSLSPGVYTLRFPTHTRTFKFSVVR